MTTKRPRIRGHKDMNDVSLSDMKWKDNALCADKELSIFFASPKSDTTITAISICKSCTVRKECFYEAMSYGYDGVWGGSTLDQRQAIIINYLNSDLTDLTRDQSDHLLTYVDKIGRTKNTALADIHNSQFIPLE